MVPKTLPYRAAPLPPNPALPDYAIQAFAEEQARLDAIRVRVAGQIQRDLARGEACAVPQEAIQLSLLDQPDPDRESRDRAYLAKSAQEYLASGAIDRAFLADSANDARQETLDRIAEDQESTRSKREACGLSNAGLQAKSGAALRNAVGYCYRTDTHASKYAPTTQANGSVPQADRLAKHLERGEISGRKLDSNVQISAECGEQAVCENRSDLPWVVRAKVEINGSVAHASGLDITRAIKAHARDAVRANARIAKLRARLA